MVRRTLAMLFIGLTIALGSQTMVSASPQESVAGSTSTSLHTLAFSDTATKKLKTSWSWYIARASGIIAAILLVLLVISGVGLLTGLTYRLLEPLPAWAIHRAIALSFGVLVVIHIVVLLFDKFVGFSWFDVLVPFASSYKPATLGNLKLGSLWVALGVIAFYAIIAVIVSSLLWMQSKPRPWKLLHYLSYVILVMVFFHGLFLGTDLTHGIWRFLWMLGAVVIAVSIISRLRRARTIGGSQ